MLTTNTMNNSLNTSLFREHATTMPTVCHVLHTLNVGGAELLAKQFALTFSGTIRPVFLCLDAIGTIGVQLRDQGFEVEVVERRPGFDHRCARHISQFMREQNVQLVHAHQYAPFFYSSLARLFGTSYPIVFTEHGRDYPDYRRSKRVWANKLLLRRHDRVVAVGECVRTALIEHEGLPSNRVAVVYNGVDASPFDFNRQDRRQVRNELGLSDSQVAVVQVARLNRLKDYGTAIRAVAALGKTSPNVHLFIVGEGEECNAIANLIQELNLQQRITMLGMRADVPRLLQGMDIFLLTSISEGIPLTLIEAMLSQLPCIATRVGGIPEVILDGETGMMAEVGHPSELAMHIQHLAHSLPDRVRMGARGRNRALDFFTASRMFSQYELIYAQLTKRITSSRVA
jgi:glycosyltransferase involved in cell wall biosynthesis